MQGKAAIDQVLRQKCEANIAFRSDSTAAWRLEEHI